MLPTGLLLCEPQNGGSRFKVQGSRFKVSSRFQVQSSRFKRGLKLAFLDVDAS